MSGDFVLTGISANFAACQRIFCGQMAIFGLLSGLFTHVRNVNIGMSGEIVFTASVALNAVGKQSVKGRRRGLVKYYTLYTLPSVWNFYKPAWNVREFFGGSLVGTL